MDELYVNKGGGVPKDGEKHRSNVNAVTPATCPTKASKCVASLIDQGIVADLFKVTNENTIEVELDNDQKPSSGPTKEQDQYLEFLKAKVNEKIFKCNGGPPTTFLEVTLSLILIFSFFDFGNNEKTNYNWNQAVKYLHFNCSGEIEK